MTPPVEMGGVHFTRGHLYSHTLGLDITIYYIYKKIMNENEVITKHVKFKKHGLRPKENLEFWELEMEDIEDLYPDPVNRAFAELLLEERAWGNKREYLALVVPLELPANSKVLVKSDQTFTLVCPFTSSAYKTAYLEYGIDADFRYMLFGSAVPDPDEIEGPNQTTFEPSLVTEDTVNGVQLSNFLIEFTLENKSSTPVLIGANRLFVYCEFSNSYIEGRLSI